MVDEPVIGMLTSMEGWSTKKLHQIKPLSAAQVKFMNDVLASFDLPGFLAVPPASQAPIVVTPPANDYQFRQLNSRMASLENKLDRLISTLQSAKPLLGGSTVTMTQAQKGAPLSGNWRSGIMRQA